MFHQKAKKNFKIFYWPSHERSTGVSIASTRSGRFCSFRLPYNKYLLYIGLRGFLMNAEQDVTDYGVSKQTILLISTGNRLGNASLYFIHFDCHITNTYLISCLMVMWRFIRTRLWHRLSFFLLFHFLFFLAFSCLHSCPDYVAEAFGRVVHSDHVTYAYAMSSK